MKKSSNGRSEMVRILVHLIDNPNAPDENGRTPIYLAASNGHAEIVESSINDEAHQKSTFLNVLF